MKLLGNKYNKIRYDYEAIVGAQENNKRDSTAIFTFFSTYFPKTITWVTWHDRWVMKKAVIHKKINTKCSSGNWYNLVATDAQIMTKSVDSASQPWSLISSIGESWTRTACFPSKESHNWYKYNPTPHAKKAQPGIWK